MCGLFGYCFTDKKAESLNNDMVKSLVKAGVEYNLHRGTDAAGWAAAYREKRKIGDDEASVWYAKRQGPGHESILPNGPYPDGIPPSLLVHTRAGTMGHASNEDNNHPVIHDHVLTTHNGTVSNHREFRTKFSKELLTVSPEPTVDSWVLSVILSQLYPDPQQIEDIPDLIREGLGNVEGGYAFASLYTTHPDWMVLTRGRGSPLVVAHHDDKGFMYASEPDALKKAMTLMGDHKWEVRDFDPGRMVVLYKGQIVQAVSYKHRERHRYYHTSSKTEATKRRVMAINDDYSSQDDSHWTNLHWSKKPVPKSVMEVPDEDDNFRWIEPNRWKAHLANAALEVAGDATAVGFYEKHMRKGDNDNRTFVLWTVPDTKIVFEHVYEADGFKLLDVYIHNMDQLQSIASRWRDIEVVEPKADKKKKKDDNGDEFAVETFKFYDYWQGAHEHKDIKEVGPKYFNKKPVKSQLPLRSSQGGSGSTNKKRTGLGSRDPLQVDERVTRSGRPGFLYAGGLSVPFPHGRCDNTDHDLKPYWTHGKEWIDCESTRYAVFDLLSNMTVDEQEHYAGALWQVFEDGLSEMYKTVTCIDDHDWEVSDFLDGLNVEYECSNCGAIRVLLGFDDNTLSRYLAEKVDYFNHLEGVF